ncbi:uncharacterized protein LOC119336038 isoform X1 [Triticum dicoccoides]|uniref:uncharacterized protein LOC119336038 isoform X1 n=1 Tax=Triticum dicoccoides TaxID=85692 RepID=UPI000E7BC9C7|nr:uncharacterized protein LOC119336038 isoform X1 [Triticum dicoccoides]XP_044436488.1 uncharacterized protein LOC123162788 isoform X1 [Triticum aestivum]
MPSRAPSEEASGVVALRIRGARLHIMLQRSLAAGNCFITSHVFAFVPDCALLSFCHVQQILLKVSIDPAPLHYSLPLIFSITGRKQVQMGNRSISTISVREAQKKYTNAIAKMKSTKDPVFITFKREYKPQGTTDPLRGDHPFSYVGYIVEYEKNGISYVQVIVTARGTPKNNIKYIL